eukprot:1157979-Pelagomonas_calceolata.AAC.3
MESAFGPPAGGGQERHKSEGVTCTQEMGVAGVGWGQDRQQGGYVDTLNGGKLLFCPLPKEKSAGAFP